MANPIRGEIDAVLDGETRTLCLTLGALAALEHSLGAGNLAGLSAKFSSGKITATDLHKIIHAGLIGAGHSVSFEQVGRMQVEGGITGYADIAARLLSATFAPDSSKP